MEYVKVGTLTLNTFDKQNRNDLEFIKKLCKDETIQKRFQGITVGLLNNNKNDFFNHGFLVTHNNEYIGYVHIGNYDEINHCIYLRAAIDSEKRGHAYGKTLLAEITEYVFENYHQIESIRLKIAHDNKPSLNTANSCGYKWLEDYFYIKYNPYFNIKKTK